jgi:hypothetical protein
MSKKVFYLFPLTLIILLSACESKVRKNDFVDLNKGWKFKTGDNLDYAKPDFDDRNWKNIEVNKTWNEQGYPKYVGFAWYRLRVFIPNSLKENAALKDSLVFNLGKIDDFDQVFLNGEMIGENTQSTEPGSEVKDSFKELDNSLWDKHRRYVLPSDSKLIKWDEENVIAIRVYDWGVAGGIFSGDLSIKMSQLSDYLKFEMNRGTFESDGENFIKNIILENTSVFYTIRTNFMIELKDNINDEVLHESVEQIELLPNEKREIVLHFKTVALVIFSAGGCHAGKLVLGSGVVGIIEMLLGNVVASKISMGDE